MSITNATLLQEAFRIAGITKRPMRTPSTDQFAEAIIIENLMIDSWNADPLDIFTSTISAWPLTGDQIVYTIGAAAAAGNIVMTAPGPGAITEANILLPTTVGAPPGFLAQGQVTVVGTTVFQYAGARFTTDGTWIGLTILINNLPYVIATVPASTELTVNVAPSGGSGVLPYSVASVASSTTASVLRQPVKILDKEEWASIRLQAIPGAITTKIYPDYGYPLGNLYVYGQPPSGYLLELYVNQLVAAFVATTDTVALPPGYQAAIVYNLAIRLAAAWKSDAGVGVSEDDRKIARDSLAQIQSRNKQPPHMASDSAGLGSGRGGGNWNWWRSGTGPG